MRVRRHPHPAFLRVDVLRESRRGGHTRSFDCRYLQEARHHDYTGGIDPKDFPHKEIRIDEAFLKDHSELIDTCGRELLAGALAIPGATDLDVRGALEALVQTYKTLESGLYYDTRPDSVFARRIMDHAQEAVQSFREEEAERTGFARTRDNDLLRIWVFLYRMALDRDLAPTQGDVVLLKASRGIELDRAVEGLDSRKKAPLERKKLPR